LGADIAVGGYEVSGSPGKGTLMIAITHLKNPITLPHYFVFILHMFHDMVTKQKPKLIEFMSTIEFAFLRF
jgi:hypothetical protein